MGVKPGGAWWILGMGAIATYGESPVYPSPGNAGSLLAEPSAFYVDLSWSSPPQGSGLNTGLSYLVYRDDTLITETESLTYRDEGLQLDTTYTYTVRAKNTYGVVDDENFAPSVEVTTLNIVTEPIALSHTGTGQFTITNYDPTVVYWVVKGDDPNGDSGGTISETGVITTNTVTQEYTLFAARFFTDDRDMSLEIKFYRQERTWRSYGCTGQRNNPCGDCAGAGCAHPCGPPCSWSCGCIGGDSGGGAWGCCICRYPTTCTEENSYTGSGYTSRHGEWVKILDPEQPSTMTIGLTPIPLSAFTGNAPFIHIFDLGYQEDIVGGTLDGTSDVSPYTKFSNASIEIYDNEKELVDVISFSEDFFIQIAEDNKCTAILVRHDMPKGSGMFDLVVTDTIGDVTYQEIGEWSNDGQSHRLTKPKKL